MEKEAAQGRQAVAQGCLLRRAAGARWVKALHGHPPLQQPCSKHEGYVEIHHAAPAPDTMLGLGNLQGGGGQELRKQQGWELWLPFKLQLNFSLLVTVFDN